MVPVPGGRSSIELSERPRTANILNDSVDVEGILNPITSVLVTADQENSRWTDRTTK